MGKSPEGFPQLHIHCDFSIKDGCAKVETYADIAVEQGLDCLAITNHGQAGGFARQYFACKERGIKPIFGMEAYVNEHRSSQVREGVAKLRARVKLKSVRPGDPEKLAKLDAFVKQKFRPSRHAIILAANREGYRNLVRMSSDSWINGFYYVPRTDTKFLAAHAEGLIYSTACMGGYIPVLARHDFEAACRESRRLRTIFEGRFYVELILTEYGPQAETNELMLRLAHEIGAPTIITCDVHYARPKDSAAQDALLLMRDKKTIKDRDAGEGVWQFESKDLYWKTRSDIARVWRANHSHYMPKEVLLRSMRNTIELAASIEDFEFDCSTKFPGVYENPDGLLRELIRSGFRDRVARGHVPASGRSKRDYMDRIHKELGIVKSKNFSEYFVMLHEICAHARSIGARMGPGRGSAGGSIIAFLLGITEIDPLRFNLLFERFLAVDRKDPPDIDLDFSPEHRDAIKEFIERRYPATATVGTYGTFGVRGTLKDVGRVYGVDHREINAVTKPLGTDADDKTWEEIFDLWPEVEKWSHDHPDAWKVVETLKGLTSYRGKHAAAMLVGPAELLDDIPMMTSTDDAGNAQVVTAIPDTQGDGVTYEGRELSRLGCLKVDILGVRNVNIAPHAVEILQRERGETVSLDPGDLPLEDEDVMRVATSGDVPGVFQLDTDSTRPILKHIKVEAFADLVMATALVRPGPLKHQIHKVYAKLKRSGEAWRDGVPEKLIPLLQDSRGLMILQEDIMHVVQVVGGLTFVEANEVRKACAKKHDVEAFAPWEKRFIEGGIERGFDRVELEGIWQKILSFAEYAFNKAHSVAYMLTAYQQLYMLAHHPDCWFAALLAETPRSQEKGAKLTRFVRSAMAHGFSVLPPDARRGPFEFDLVDGAIHYGLSKIKGVASGADAIIEARPFDSLETLYERLTRLKLARKANARVFTALAYAGALDGLPFERPEGFEDVEGIEVRNAIIRRYEEMKKVKEEKLTAPLAGLKLMAAEREVLGLALSWWSSTEKDWLRRTHKLKSIKQCLDDDLTHLPLVVEVARAHTHKDRSGKPMAFLTVADETGTLDNIVVWSSQWAVWRQKLAKGRLSVVRLKRTESRDRKYGRWTYNLDDRRGRDPVESVQQIIRRARAAGEDV